MIFVSAHEMFRYSLQATLTASRNSLNLEFVSLANAFCYLHNTMWNFLLKPLCPFQKMLLKTYHTVLIPSCVALFENSAFAWEVY